MKFSIFVSVATYAVAVSARGHPHGIFNARTGTTTDLSACNSDSDCASGCCGFTSAICEGPCVALQRDGCGHSDALSNSNAAAALGSCSSLVSSYKPSAAAGAPPAATAAANSASSGSAATSNNAGSGAAAGTITDTNACSADSDCASGCCGFTSGICEGPCVALQRDGCGHGTSLSNSNAAAALGTCSSLVSSYKPSAAAGAPPAATPAASSNSASSGSAATSNNASGSSLTRGTQFITGPCSVNNDCVSGCCVASSKLCGATLAQAKGAAACTGGTALPSLDA